MEILTFLVLLGKCLSQVIGSTMGDCYHGDLYLLAHLGKNLYTYMHILELQIIC